MTTYMTLNEARDLAYKATRELDERNGDPSKRANFGRERQLARLVVALVDRIKLLNASLESL